jgi:hypothetical protein
MRRAQALDAIPDGFAFFCNFGHPGEPGCTEVYKDAAGNRFVLSNGPWSGSGMNWTATLNPKEPGQ